MQEGVIKMLKNGFGFIKTENGDIFFHANNLVEGVEYDDLEEGMSMTFELGEGRDGKEQAVNISVAEEQTAA
ncbi:MAG: cold shock domain-containing protein [Candidatus Gracilibacteria bacterium]|nr:cold shock domain-containing protein [Candidatus Gracilibacteria bacterium]MDQ7023364.1 cold shock domain-containing protein [Candidatus Gracilibacteria bacterium]